MNWVAWDRTIAPEEYGGLGFGSLRDANLAMLAKWWWRFKTEKDGLWRRVVWAIHHNSRGWKDIPTKVSIPGPWKSITSIRSILLQAGLDLEKATSAELVNGKNICFWLDCWAGNEPLYVMFPELFRAEKHKECLVQDRLATNGPNLIFSWAWLTPELGVIEADQLNQVVGLICGSSGLNMSSGMDRWQWTLDGGGSFSVASIKKTLSSVNRVRPGKAFEWNNWVPKKVGIVAWRAEMERLPTRCALAARSIPVNDRTCIMCGSYDESSEHLLVSCQFAQMVWQNIALWCSIPPIIAFDLKDMLTLHEVCTVFGKKRKVLHAVILVAIWSIWKSRNEAVFQQKSPNMTKTLDEIKAMAYLWVKNRSRSMTLTWEDWSKFKI
ncbi:uncharacterized protein LOC110893153 [Helianthus annuus]|uniref:uncharacterized protein LOC110893153 n=1 Tax=Helianthus annuus TaxID=4232 RepID=UPI000B8F19B3|nr:uncharacterized protein LOC110893153 [Helianthus annuus]